MVSIARHAPDCHSSEFEYWWNIDGEWVDKPNRRQSGESAVKRVTKSGSTYYIKLQTNFTYRSLSHPLGQPTIEREVRAISVCRQLGVQVPEIVFHTTRKGKEGWQAILVTRELAGFVSLAEWLASQEKETIHSLLPDVIEKMAENIARIHRARWQHGCLYDKHLFVKTTKTDTGPKVEIALIDLEKFRRRFLSSQASKRDIDQLKRHLPGFDNRAWQLFDRLYAEYMARQKC